MFFRPKNTIKIAGWIPAFILPTATLLQLIKVFGGSLEGVSALTWLLFGLANAGSYIFTEKYFSPQAIFAFGITALMDFMIVGFVLFKG